MTLIIFFIVLSVLVLIHELGHFLAARIFGVKAYEFGFGFPPRLLGYVKDRGRWKRVKNGDKTDYKNTIWSINWLPFGGFVRLKGEQEDGIDDADSMAVKPIWQRLIIIAGGVAMNWLLAVVLFFIAFTFGVTAILDELPENAKVTRRATVITQVLPSSPAAEAGIEAGDEVRDIAGSFPTDEKMARDLIGAKGTETFDVKVKRGDEELTLKVTPRLIQEIGKPGLGVGLANVGEVSFPPHEAAWQAVHMTYSMTKAVLWAFGGIFKDLVVKREVTQDLSGPVGIAVMTGQVARQGLMPLIQFAAMLSVNLAVINFLPIPALDGGRVVFLILEKIRRRPVSRKLEIAVHNIAFILLILIIVLVTARDLFRYGGMIVGGVKGLVGM
jgi:regulator of sigma E protease